MNMTMKTAVGAGFALFLAQAGFAAAPAYRHFELGAGCYGGPQGGIPLDTARTEWSYLGLGNVSASKGTADKLNELFALNPKHKIVIRLWPKPGYLPKGADPKTPKNYITHFDYRYCPEAREAFLKECRRELDVFLENVTHPENIYGYTLFEELPHQFGGDVSLLDKIDPKTKLTGQMRAFADHFKKEKGKELTEWNEDARRWWGETFAWSIRDVYSTLKKEYPKLHGFVYFMSHYRPLDWLEAGEPVHSFRVIPCKWSDMVEPGVAADGFFAYCNNARWAKRYQDLATGHHWPYFTQLSHPAGMRISSWKECLDIANSPIPENLGYFYYEWDYSYGWWNDDPDVPPEDRELLGGCADPAMAARFRQYFAKLGLNMDIVKRHVKPTVRIGHEIGGTELHSYQLVGATIINDRDPKWFPTPEEATLVNVKAKLSVPKEFSIPDTVSCPPEVTIPRLAPGERKNVMWWVRRDAASPDPSNLVVSVSVAADGVDPVVVTGNTPTFASEQPTVFDVARSGEKFHYVDWTIPWIRNELEITIEPVPNGGSAVVDPAIQLGMKRMLWRDVVPNGKKLVLGPGAKATLCERDGKKPVDVTDRLVGPGLHPAKGANTFTYFDNYTPGIGPKAKVTLKVITSK